MGRFRFIRPQINTVDNLNIFDIWPGPSHVIVFPRVIIYVKTLDIVPLAALQRDRTRILLARVSIPIISAYISVLWNISNHGAIHRVII